MLMHCNMFSFFATKLHHPEEWCLQTACGHFFFEDASALEQHVVCVQVDTRGELKSCG